MNIETRTETITTIELDEEEILEAVAYWLYHWKGYKVDKREDINFDCREGFLRMAKVDIIETI